MNDKLIFAFRVSLALVWLYNGLWLKIITLDSHHLTIVQSVFHDTQIDPALALKAIGSGETLLAIGILSGLFYRAVSIFQICIIAAMNVAGIVFGGGAIQHPIGLLISNMPTIMCAVAIAVHGPGWASLSRKRNG